LDDGNIPARTAGGIEVMEFIFCVLFASEWIMRVMVHRGSFFVMKGWYWNIVDTVIVTFQVVDQIITLFFFQGNKRGILAAMRMIRLVRIIRLMRLLYLVKELKVLVNSVMKSAQSLCWALLLLVMMVFSFSVLLSQLALNAKTGQDDPAVVNDIDYWFGNLARTALTLVEAIMGGVSWDEPAMILFNHVHGGSTCLFVFFVAFGLFVLLNVVTAVFVDKAMKTATEEADFNMAMGICSIFLEIEDDDITWEVFADKLETQELKDYFKLINVDISEARGLFELIDVDGSGSVDGNEIVEGCLRLRGPARALDLSLLMKMQERMNEKIDEHIEHVDEHVFSIAQKLGIDITGDE